MDSESPSFISIYKRGFVTFDLPQHILDNIKKRIKYHTDNNFKELTPYNKNLVGLIVNEFHFPECSEQILPYLQKAADCYLKEYKNDSKNVVYRKVSDDKLDLWINFQKKLETNPPHLHNGNLSFVIWINIPYNTEEELQYLDNKDFKEGKEFGGGYFNFLIPDQFSRAGIYMYKIPVDRRFEGKGILFESSTMHMVNPFFCSDGYRVSIAGNLDFSNN